MQKKKHRKKNPTTRCPSKGLHRPALITLPTLKPSAAALRLEAAWASFALFIDIHADSPPSHRRGEEGCCPAPPQKMCVGRHTCGGGTETGNGMPPAQLAAQRPARLPPGCCLLRGEGDVRNRCTNSGEDSSVFCDFWMQDTGMIILATLHSHQAGGTAISLLRPADLGNCTVPARGPLGSNAAQTGTGRQASL